ncbi:MAG: DUF1318 domain-containing protein [Leptospiraceae bacterium]|nr:DUF1318 domain-containing protein [Leptospiraceae bacterium]
MITAGCLSLKPPPITFTQTQTSAEKQMVGEDKELEKNGWLIASIKTSSSGSENWQKESADDDSSDKDYMIALRTIAYFAGELKKYKRHGILGESLDGSVRRNPLTKESKFEKDYSKPDLVKRVDEVVKIINEAREKVLNTRLEKEKKKNLSPKELLILRENLALTYYRETTTGEYFESQKGKWLRKE